MGDPVRKSHDASLLMHHIVCVAKHRRLAVAEEVESVFESVCIEISKRHEIRFLELGAEAGRVHFLVQSVPTYSPTMMAAKIKSTAVREIFAKVPSVKRELWGGEFWPEGYFVPTAGEHANEDVLRHHVRNQGRAGECKQLHRQNVARHEQPALFRQALPRSLGRGILFFKQFLGKTDGMKFLQWVVGQTSRCFKFISATTACCLFPSTFLPHYPPVQLPAENRIAPTWLSSFFADGNASPASLETRCRSVAADLPTGFAGPPALPTATCCFLGTTFLQAFQK